MAAHAPPRHRAPQPPCPPRLAHFLMTLAAGISSHRSSLEPMHQPIHSSFGLAFLAAVVALPSCHAEDPPETTPAPSALSTSQKSFANRPNIIVFMLDDLDVASFAQLMSDPDLDLLPNIREHLVEKGVSFSESFVSNAVCCPSRVTFLTGQHSHNSGTAALGGSNGGYESFKPRQNDALAKWLQTAGYYTGHVGKYLNGYTAAEASTAPLGWDEWHALVDPSTYDIDEYEIRECYPGLPGKCRTQSYTGGLTGNSYQTDVLASRTRDIITRWRLHEPRKPLFISVMPTAPHVEATRCWNKELNHRGQLNAEIRPKGWNPAGEKSGKYGALRALTTDEKVIEHEPASAAFQLPSASTVAFDEADISDKPRYLRDGTIPGAGWPMLANATVCDAPHATAKTVQCKDWPPQHCSMPHGKPISVLDALQRQHLGRLESMLSVDDMVGTVMALADPDLGDIDLDNTVFIFTSDNGYLLGEHRLVNKQQPYEESIRVPLVIRPPASSTVVRGSSQGSLVVNTDIPATILDYAGVEAPANQPLDGRSLKSILQGTATTLSRRRLLIEHFFSRFPNGITFYDVPDYAGVRTAASAGTSGAHSTYVEYYEPHAPWAPGMIWDGKTTDREYYTLATDPTQLASRHDDPSTAEERLILSEHLAALRYCRGAACMLAEDRLDFTSRTFLPVVTASSPDPGAPGFFHPGAKHHSGIVIHNPSSTTTADALLMFHGAVNDFNRAESLTLAPGASQVVQPAKLSHFPPGFVGSATVASNVPLLVMVNTTTKLDGEGGVSGGNSAAQYVGIDASRTASKLRVPVVKKLHGGKNTAVYVQNAGTVATDITATFIPVGSSTGYERKVLGVPPRKVVSLRPQDVPSLPSGLSAVTITNNVAGVPDAGVPLAGVSMEYEVDSTGAPIYPAQRLQATHAFAQIGTFRDAGTTIHFPAVKRLLQGRTTGHQVQNVSNEPVRVRLTYHRSARCAALTNAPAFQETPVPVAPGASHTFYDWTDLGTNCLTNATATAVDGSDDSFLVGITSERCNDLTLCRNTLTTHAAIPSQRATTTLVAPLFKESSPTSRPGSRCSTPPRPPPR
jgi:N-acetylglucosamine-6-sulfatase